MRCILPCTWCNRRVSRPRRVKAASKRDGVGPYGVASLLNRRGGGAQRNQISEYLGNVIARFRAISSVASDFRIFIFFPRFSFLLQNSRIFTILSWRGRGGGMSPAAMPLCRTTSHYASTLWLQRWRWHFSHNRGHPVVYTFPLGSLNQHDAAVFYNQLFSKPWLNSNMIKEILRSLVDHHRDQMFWF